MMANLGAFLGSLLYGLPGILPNAEKPETWPERRVILPAGWRSIEVERLWVRGRPARLVASHGSDAARLELGPPPWAPRADRVTSIAQRREARVERDRDLAIGGPAGT